MRVLSGIQSNGKLHLGNYLGAMTQYVELQKDHECFFFIANYHALTTVRNGEELRRYTRDVAIDYLAVGLDPDKAHLFRQTDVPEVTELAWILSTVTGKGLMDRATSYKDKMAQGVTPNMGLYCYPLLMAADILIYRSDIVPVGKDQIQHIEMTQDMAGYVNAACGREVLKRPEPKLNDAMVVPGIDGRKMSKSYHNTIDMFDPATIMKKRIMGIKTDSTPVESPKNPDGCSVFALYKLLATPEETETLEQQYRAGGLGYGEAKKALVEVIERIFAPARERRERFVNDPDLVEDILMTAGRRAREVAASVMADVRDAFGLVCGKDTHP